MRNNKKQASKTKKLNMIKDKPQNVLKKKISNFKKSLDMKNEIPTTDIMTKNEHFQYNNKHNDLTIDNLTLKSNQVELDSLRTNQTKIKLTKLASKSKTSLDNDNDAGKNEFKHVQIRNTQISLKRFPGNKNKKHKPILRRNKNGRIDRRFKSNSSIDALLENPKARSNTSNIDSPPCLSIDDSKEMKNQIYSKKNQTQVKNTKKTPIQKQKCYESNFLAHEKDFNVDIKAQHDGLVSEEDIYSGSNSKPIRNFMSHQEKSSDLSFDFSTESTHSVKKSFIPVHDDESENHENQISNNKKLTSLFSKNLTEYCGFPFKYEPVCSKTFIRRKSKIEKFCTAGMDEKQKDDNLDLKNYINQQSKECSKVEKELDIYFKSKEHINENLKNPDHEINKDDCINVNNKNSESSLYSRSNNLLYNRAELEKEYDKCSKLTEDILDDIHNSALKACKDIKSEAFSDQDETISIRSMKLSSFNDLEKNPTSIEDPDNSEVTECLSLSNEGSKKRKCYNSKYISHEVNEIFSRSKSFDIISYGEDEKNYQDSRRHSLLTLAKSVEYLQCDKPTDDLYVNSEQKMVNMGSDYKNKTNKLNINNQISVEYVSLNNFNNINIIENENSTESSQNVKEKKRIFENFNKHKLFKNVSYDNNIDRLNYENLNYEYSAKENVKDLNYDIKESNHSKKDIYYNKNKFCKANTLKTTGNYDLQREFKEESDYLLSQHNNCSDLNTNDLHRYNETGPVKSKCEGEIYCDVPIKDISKDQVVSPKTNVNLDQIPIKMNLSSNVRNQRVNVKNDRDKSSAMLNSVFKIESFEKFKEKKFCAEQNSFPMSRGRGGRSSKIVNAQTLDDVASIMDGSDFLKTGKNRMFSGANKFNSSTKEKYEKKIQMRFIKTFESISEVKGFTKKTNDILEDELLSYYHSKIKILDTEPFFVCSASKDKQEKIDADNKKAKQDQMYELLANLEDMVTSIDTKMNKYNEILQSKIKDKYDIYFIMLNGALYSRKRSEILEYIKFKIGELQNEKSKITNILDNLYY